MSTFRRIMLNGGLDIGLDIDVDSLPETQKIYYTATFRVKPRTNSLGIVIVNKWNSSTKEGVIACENTIKEIGDNAFYNCSNLTSVTIPNSVTTIGDGAFGSCRNLKEFKSKFASEDGRCLIIGGELVAFAPAGISEYTIPNSVTTIGEGVFYGCDSLTSVTIPDSVTSIGDSAFAYCGRITNITIGNSVTTIGNNAFDGCNRLTNIYLRDISAWCNISFGNTRSNPLYYENNLYLNNKLVTDLTIPDSVTKIANATFYNCKSITSVTIPDSVSSIGNVAFRGCSNLASITIGNSVTSIGDYAFNSCSNLISVTIPDNVKTIGQEVFYDCSSLTSVIIGSGVTSIKKGAFWNCSNLASVYCKATTPPALNRNRIFYNTRSDCKIYVPTSSVNAYKNATNWSEHADAIIGYDFENNIPVE